MAPVSLSIDRLESNTIVTSKLLPLFYVESTNQHSLKFIQPPLLRCLQNSILRLKNFYQSLYFYFSIFATFVRIFQEMKLIISEYTFTI